MKKGRPSGTAEKWRVGSGAVSKPLSQRFWEKVDIRGDDECWEWKAFVHPSGYGMIKVGSRMVAAHRVSWTLTHGEIPDGMCICHHCDNPPCVNPNHLFLGTYQDNTDDREQKGRNKIPDNRGSNHGLSKLIESQVLEILAYPRVPSKILAEKFSVRSATITRIRRGERWKHLQEIN